MGKRNEVGFAPESEKQKDGDIDEFPYHRFKFIADKIEFVNPMSRSELPHIKCYPFGQRKGIVDS